MIKIINYFLIPVIIFLTAYCGGVITNRGLSWYKKIKLPSFTPPEYFIGFAWTIIFILLAVSIIIAAIGLSGNAFLWLMALFILNLILNFSWSSLFFGRHLLGLAAFESLLLEFSIFALIVYIWPSSMLAAALLFPYAGWVAFATILTYLIWSLNRN